MLAVSILWIVAGVIYLIYQAFKDYPKTSFAFVKYLVLPVVGILGISFLLDKIGCPWADMIPSTSFLVGIIYLFWWSHTPDNPEKIAEQKQEQFEKWKAFMKNNGCPRIRDEDVQLLISHPHSPLNGEKLRVTSEELYVWLCKHHSSDLEMMPDDKLEKLIGNVPIKEMPVDDTLSPYKAKEKLRNLIIIKILKEQYGGLMYIRWSNARVIYPETDEYVSKVYSFIRDYNNHSYNSEHH